MRRSQVLFLVAALSLTTLAVLLAALTAAPVTALPVGSPAEAFMEGTGQQVEEGEQLATFHPDALPNVSTQTNAKVEDKLLEPVPSLNIIVNYGHDWVGGTTDPSTTVVITITDDADTIKDTASVSADGSGDFWVGCGDWVSGECTNIVAGDKVYAAVPGASTSVDPVGSIEGTMDIDTDIVSLALYQPGLNNPTTVQCEVGQSAVISGTISPDGGTFDCDFAGVWDLQKFDDVAILYFEGDGDIVVNMPPWPWSRVNYAHNWVGGNYNAGHTFWITVTDSSDDHKASNTTFSDPWQGWGGPGFDTGSTPWLPDQPDIQPGDFVHITGDDDYTNTLEVGEISGTLDTSTDSVEGTITAPFTNSLLVECWPWGAWDVGIDAPVITDVVTPDGLDSFLCDWDAGTEWDIQPGQDVAVAYQEPDGDYIIDVYRQSSPYLRINKWAQGDPGMGGNFRYTIEYWNDGDAPADAVFITDTFENLTYLSDTSGLPYGGDTSGPIVWDLGTVDPGEYGSFEVFFSVDVGQGEFISNTVRIGTPFPDQGDPSEKIANWWNEVRAKDSLMDVGKSAWTGDPAPGESVVFAVNVCNYGSTASSMLYLDDLLMHPQLIYDTFFAQHPGWEETYSGPEGLSLLSPSIPGNSCSEVYIKAWVHSELGPGTWLTNTAIITSSSPVVGEGKADWEGWTSDPYANLYIEKSWHWGQLTPSGELTYGVHYYNHGNIPVGPFRITDTLPAGTTFVSASHNDLFGGTDFTPDFVSDEYVYWDFSGLENGTGGDIEITLAVDPDATPGLELVNTAEITRLPEESTHEDNQSSLTVVLNELGPNLRVRKWHNWDWEGHLSYQVQFENIGSEIVSDVWLTDTLPTGTTWDEWWDMSFDWERWITTTVSSEQLALNLSEMYPGDSGWFYFGANLDEPGVPVRWFTNTVEITLPEDDVYPDDNYFEDQAFSGAEVDRVEFWFNLDGSASMWGQAVPGTNVTITTPYTQIVAWADPGSGDWEAGFVGQLSPGEQVTVTAGAGLLPVAVDTPYPIEAEVDTSGEVVFGIIGGWFNRPVEIHGNWPDGYQEVTSDGSGGFIASYPGMPRGVDGDIRFMDQVDYTQVIYHRPFYASDLVLEINYGHDWIQGLYEPGHTVWITVTESDGSTVKGQAELPTDYIEWFDNTGFSTDWSGWQGERPDIQAGDWVFAAVDNGYTNTVKVGDIEINADYGVDQVSGHLYADWITAPLVDLRCDMWGHPDNPVIDETAVPDGGSYLCDFGTAGYDIELGQTAAVHYWDDDGDQIYNTYDSPRIWAAIGPWSGGDRRVEGSGAEPATTVTVTVTDEGDPVAATTTTSDPDGNWSTGDNLPEGTLAFWNEVLVEQIGFTDVLTIYPMSGEANPDTDVITVTAAGPPFFTVDLEICTVDWCQWFWQREIGESGVIVVDMAGEFSFDVQYGQEFYAHLGVWHGHLVSYRWALPAPELSIWKWHSGSYARPGGVEVYGIQYQVDGNGQAEDLTIVDHFDATYLSYAGDTSGVVPEIDPGGTITWNLGTQYPGTQRVFMVTFNVDPSAPPGPGQIAENCVEISTSSPGESYLGDNGECSGPVDIVEDDVEMSVGKSSSPGDPTPGQEFYYDIRICNNRGAAAGSMLLTDTLPAEVFLIDWWPDNWQDNYWDVVSIDSHELVLYAPGFPGGFCQGITLLVELDSSAEISTTIENLVYLDVASDVDPENNWQSHQAHISPPRSDFGINKYLDGGVLVPGGRAHFSVWWQNNGNVASGVIITDTVPPGLIYDGAWWGGNTPWSNQPVPDPIAIGDQLVWYLPENPVAWQLGFQVQFKIDPSYTPGGEDQNCVSITSDLPDSWPVDNSSCVPFTVFPAGPNLAIRKWHDWNGDGQLQYTIYFLNIGNEPIENVWITDTLPSSISWNGNWEYNYDWSRLIGDVITGENQLMWNLSRLDPGDTGDIRLQVDLEFPGQPLQWFTNTVEITEPPGDTNTDDNTFKDVAFSGGEINWVDLNVYDTGIWGNFNADSITVTTQYEEENFGCCDFSWNFNQPFLPGDIVTLTAGAGLAPVIIEIPDPFDAEGSSLTDMVQGQIDHLDGAWIEVGLEGGPDLLVQTDASGNFSVQFDEIPRGSSGEVRYRYQYDYTEVTLHRYWRSPDLILEVNYAHDWIQGWYPVGHTVWITVTEWDGTPKGTATLETHDFGGWTGFSTDDGWSTGQPDIIPGDWVYGRVDNGFNSDVQVFSIDGLVDVDLNLAAGTVDAPWFLGIVDSLEVACNPWSAWDQGQNEVQVKFDWVVPDGADPFECVWGDEWDIQYLDDIGVYVAEPDGDYVINVLSAEAVELEISKWHQGAMAQPGGVVLYGIYYRNNGNALAQDVIITDTLPTNTSYGDDTSGLPVTIGAGGVITWDVGQLERGEEGYIWVTLELDQGTPEEEGALGPNCVSITSSTEPELDPGNNTACSEPVDVAYGEVELGIDKWVNPGDPTPGQEFFYTVNWCNNRPAAVGSVWLTDTLPVGAIYHGWWEEQWWQHYWTEISYNGTELVLEAPSLPGNSCENITIWMELPEDAVIGESLINEVAIFAENDVDTGNNWRHHETTISPPRLDLRIYKQFHNGVLAPGGWINYLIDFSNDGNVASGVRITETIPNGLTFNRAWWGGGQPDDGQPLPPPSEIDGLLVWELGDLPVASGRWFHLELGIPEDTEPGEFGNCVEIGGDEPDSNVENNSSCTAVTIFPSGPNVRITKSAQWSNEGQNIDYQITFLNVGDVPLYSVPFTDTFPAGTFTSTVPTSNFGYPVENIDLTGQGQWGFLVEEMYPGDKGEIWFQLGLDEPGVPGLFFTNTIEAAALPGEVDTSDNYSETVSSTGPDLYLGKWFADGQMLPGEEVTFILNFGNRREESWWGLQYNAVVTDVLPEGLEYITSTIRFCLQPEEWCGFPAVQDGDTLSWELWPIGAGQWNEIALTVRITDTAEGDDVFTNWAEILSSEPSIDIEPNYDDNEESAPVVIALPKFEVSKVYGGSEVAGMIVTYTLTVENTGSEPGTNVILKDTLPAGLTYGGGDGSFDGTNVSWTFPEILAEGGTASGYFTATLPCTGTISNDAYWIDSTDQGVTSLPGEEVTFDILTPSIDLILSHTPEPIVVGSTVYFTATGTTDGTPLSYAWDFGDGEIGAGAYTSHVYTSDAAYDIVLTATDTCGYYLTDETTILIDEPALVASFDQSATAIPIHSTVYFTDTSATDGPDIVAWEWDFGDGSAPVYTQNASHIYHAFGSFDVTLVVTDALGYSDTVVVNDAVSTLAPVFEIGKEYESTEVAGTLVTYTLTFTNIGSLSGTGIVITDDLPSNVTWVSGGSYDNVSGIVSWNWPSLAPGAHASVQFVAQLGCSGQVVNDKYMVASSTEGSTSELGTPVIFNIQSPSITASFSQSLDVVVVNDTVTFTSTSTTNGGPLTSWLWDFGDGAAGTGMTTSHAYTETGEYNVELTVADACAYSDTVTVPGAVTVEEGEFLTFLPMLMKPD